MRIRYSTSRGGRAALLAAGVVTSALLLVVPSGPVAASPVVGASIAGTVVDAHGRPVAGLVVQVVGPTRGLGQGETDAQGDFVVDRLEAGTYEVFTGHGPDTGDGVYGGNGTAAQATPVHVVAGQQVTGVDITLGPPATVTGTVTDAQTGQPLPDVDVTIRSFGGGPIYDPAEESGVRTTTDAHGRYVLNVDGAWRYEVGAGGLPSYEDQDDAPGDAGFPFQWHGGADASHEGAPVAVASGRTTTLDLALQPAASVSGTLTLAGTNQPAVGVQVDLGADYGYDYTHAQTDSQGHWELDGLVPGTDDVVYDAGRQDPDVVGATSSGVVLRPGQQTQVVAQVSQAAHVSGTVVDPDGDPVYGTAVELSPVNDTDPDDRIQGSTDPDGDFGLDGVPPGRYTLAFYPGGRAAEVDGLVPQWWQGAETEADATVLTLAAGEHRQDVDATLHRGATVSGRVTDASGDPVPHLLVEAFAGANDAAYQGTTDADGAYTIVGLPAGTDYRIGVDGGDAYAAAYWGGAPWRQEARTLSVTEGQDVQGVDVVVHPGGSIRGTVRTTDGEGAHRVVEIAPVGEGDEPIGRDWPETVASSAGGQFDFPQLRPGTYRIGPFCAQDGTPASGPVVDVTLRGHDDVTQDLTLADGQNSDCFPDVLPAGSQSPQLTGRARVGRVLHVRPWRVRTPQVLVTYSWFAGSKQIRGALGTQLRLRRSFRGKRISVHAVVSRTGYRPLRLHSRPTGKVR